jgi:diguanylate cyclase (GGDEF)-like protein
MEEPKEVRLTLRTKVLLIMIVPVAVLAGATFALLQSSQDAGDALNAERRTAALRAAYEQVLVDMADAETATRGYVLTGERSFLEPFELSQDRLPTDIGALDDLTKGTPEHAAAVSELRALANQRLSILQTSQLLAPIDELTNRAQLIGLMKTGKDVMDEIRALLQREEAASTRALFERQRALDASHRRSFLIGIVGMPLGVLASLILIALFTERLVSRIHRTETIARRLDQGLPLGQPSASEDELGELERVLVRSGTRVVELQDELRRMGTSDALTRSMNRRGFLPTAEHQLLVAKREHRSMALMFLDLDGLKRVNDTLGHSAGDAMLTEGAFVMRETFRAADLIARMGGDEFCVLYDADSYEAAATALTRLQGAVEDVNAQQGRQYQLSFSAGIAMFDPDGSDTLEQLIALADERMYASKRAKQADPGSAVAIA